MSAAMSSGQGRLWAVPARGVRVAACAAALLLSASAGPAVAFLLGEVVYGEAAEDLEPAFVPPASILRTGAPGPASESRLRLPILAEGGDIRPLGEQLAQEWVLPGNPGLAPGEGPAAAGAAAPGQAGDSWLDALLAPGSAPSDLVGALRSGLAGIAAVDEIGLLGRPGPGSILQLPAVAPQAGLGWPGLPGGSEPGPLDQIGLSEGFFLGSPLLPGSIFSGPQDALPAGAGGSGLWNPAPRP